LANQGNGCLRPAQLPVLPSGKRKSLRLKKKSELPHAHGKLEVRVAGTQRSVAVPSVSYLTHQIPIPPTPKTLALNPQIQPDPQPIPAISRRSSDPPHLSLFLLLPTNPGSVGLSREFLLDFTPYDGCSNPSSLLRGGTDTTTVPIPIQILKTPFIFLVPVSQVCSSKSRGASVWVSAMGKEMTGSTSLPGDGKLVYLRIEQSVPTFWSVQRVLH
jgi:hypothetical protein